MANASADSSAIRERQERESETQAHEPRDAIEWVQKLDPDFALTQLEKVLYPENGLRKVELMAYYTLLADWMLPHVAGRPLVLLRCPEGRRKKCSFHRHIDPGAPAAIGRVTIREARGEGAYGFIEDLQGLLALAQLGVLEIHTWGCHVRTLEKPDQFVFGLDPDPELTFERVVEAAFALREQLAVLGLESFVKTSGGGGLHVVVPVATGHDWEVHEAFAHSLVSAMTKAEPHRYTTSTRKPARRGKIVLDSRRNARGASALAPYSPRAVSSGARIAMPLSWQELEQGARPEHFDLPGVIRKLEGNADDPWQGLRELVQPLPSRALCERLAVA